MLIIRTKYCSLNMKCPPTPKLMTLFTRDLLPYLLYLVPHFAFGGKVLPHNTFTLPVIMVYFYHTLLQKQKS